MWLLKRLKAAISPAEMTFQGGSSMPRAHRFHLPGHAWHITHRCHRQQFLLKFLRDRRSWRRWLFEARKRYGLCVLDYMVTSNHIHLLVLDQGKGEIARSMQLIAGRTAQAYNRRKHRKGAYWEDRYHATAVQSDPHLSRCMAYIDLNMVRAGAVAHPGEWEVSGYRHIQRPPSRYRIIDYSALQSLLCFETLTQLQHGQRKWADEALEADAIERNALWTQSVAIGSREFVTQLQAALEPSANHRLIEENENGWALQEAPASYTPHFRWQKAGLSG